MNTQLYLQAAQLEFEWLCNQIVCDGRDPYIVACAMAERLARDVKEINTLWNELNLVPNESANIAEVGSPYSNRPRHF